MRNIIIYKSKTDFTKKYAMWIAKELNCAAVEISKLKRLDLDTYDMYIYGGGLYGGKINGLSALLDLYNNNEIKNLTVFATGATPQNDTESTEKFWRMNLDEDEIKRIPHFYFEAGLNYDKMSFLNKRLLKLFSRFLSWKTAKDGKNETYPLNESFDVSTPENIRPLVNFIDSL